MGIFKKIIYVSFLMVLLFTSDAKENEQVTTTSFVTMYNLITTPERYHNKEIHVVGVFHPFISEAYLYPSKEYMEENIAASIITIDLANFLTVDNMEQYLELKGQFVTVVGIFDANHKGVYGLGKGMIYKVSVIE